MNLHKINRQIYLLCAVDGMSVSAAVDGMSDDAADVDAFVTLGGNVVPEK